MIFSDVFNEQHTLMIHVIQIILTILVIAFSIARMTIMNPPPTRANAVGITLGFKSLIVISYQLLTEHKASFQKWASTKANAILNCLEVVFWLAVVVVSGMSLSRSSGKAAAMSALAMLLSMVLDVLAVWTAVVSVKVHRRSKYGSKEYGSAQTIV